MKTLLRRMALAVALVTLAVSVGLVWLLRTESGRGGLAALVSTLAGAGSERRITLEGLGGRLPFELRLAR